MAPPGEHGQKVTMAVKLGVPTNGDHLHMAAMKVALELVDVLRDDTFIGGVKLASMTVVVESAIAPTRKVFFDVHGEMSLMMRGGKGPSESEHREKGEGRRGVRACRALSMGSGDSIMFGPWSPRPTMDYPRLDWLYRQDATSRCDMSASDPCRERWVRAAEAWANGGAACLINGYPRKYCICSREMCVGYKRQGCGGTDGNHWEQSCASRSLQWLCGIATTIATIKQASQQNRINSQQQMGEPGANWMRQEARRSFG